MSLGFRWDRKSIKEQIRSGEVTLDEALLRASDASASTKAKWRKAAKGRA